MERSTVSGLIERLNRDADLLARRFGLRFKSIRAERANVKRRYGVCYADGAIQIRLRHAVTGRPLRYSSLVNTLCHELAHLRHFNHGLRFRAFYLEILAFAREQGIYRPQRPAERALAQVTPRRVTQGTAQAVAQRAAQKAAQTSRSSPDQLSLFG